VVTESLPADVPPGAAAGTGRAIWLVPLHRAEVALAGGLLRLLRAPGDRQPWSQKGVLQLARPALAEPQLLRGRLQPSGGTKDPIDPGRMAVPL
jgi:hypothetical protein